MKSPIRLLAFTSLSVLLTTVCIIVVLSTEARAKAHWQEVEIPGTSTEAITLGKDLDNDGDPDEVNIRLEVIEIQEQVYPGEFVTSWVFAPEGQGMIAESRTPSPTIRVEEGDRVKITLSNTHYFPHTIHFHGTIHPNTMDGVPDITQKAVAPGQSFTYEFIAKNPGTHFYHCHVQPNVHVLMGLAGMFIIEPNRANNRFSHLVPGAGKMPDLAKATAEQYQQEYSLVYTDIDARLNRIPALFSDPREIEKRMHRDYQSTQRQANIFMLNGRSFPFTLLDTPIKVKSGERVKLRILNAGVRQMKLHTHGHHPILTHVDGYPLPENQQLARDVFDLGAAQRIDLELRPGSDNDYASGPGVWLVHDHTGHTVTNKGISPGGDLTAIVYEGYMVPETGLPQVATSLEQYFDQAYYRGEVPVFDPKIFHTTTKAYQLGWPEDESYTGNPYPQRNEVANLRNSTLIDDHQVKANSCAEPNSFRRVFLEAGTNIANEGEVFAFKPNVINAKPCEGIEIVMKNTDSVRHALMIPGLNPMFTLEFIGPDTQSARFVTPDTNITLEFHCHVETHEKMGMHGSLIVGTGSPPETHAAHEHEEKLLYQGVGVVIAILPRKGRLVIDHEEIPDFMAAMEMSYQVSPASLLQQISSGDKVRFTIDANKRAIVDITPIIQSN